MTLNKDLLADIQITLINVEKPTRTLQRVGGAGGSSSGNFLQTTLLSGIVGMVSRRRMRGRSNMRQFGVNNRDTRRRLSAEMLIPSKYKTTADMQADILKKRERAKRYWRSKGLSPEEVEAKANEQLAKHAGQFQAERFKRGEIDSPMQRPAPQNYDPTEANDAELKKLNAGLFSPVSNEKLSTTQKMILERYGGADIKFSKERVAQPKNINVNALGKAKAMPDTTNMMADTTPIDLLNRQTNFGNSETQQATVSGNTTTRAARETGDDISRVLRFREGER